MCNIGVATVDAAMAAAAAAVVAGAVVAGAAATTTGAAVAMVVLQKLNDFCCIYKASTDNAAFGRSTSDVR